MALFKPKRIDINERGLAKILGVLEADILECIWQSNGASARRVCDHLNKKKKISFNAVNTVIGRLVDKGVLLKKKKDGCFQYLPKYSQKKLYQLISQDVLTSLLRDKKIFTIASFADALRDLTQDEKKELLNKLQGHG